MPKTRAQKEATVALLTQRLTDCESAVIVDYRGLTVAEMQDIRKRLGAAGSDFLVAKNRLIRLALANCGMSLVDSAGNDHDPLLVGVTAISFGYSDPSAPAKILLEASDKLEHLELKGGFFGKEPVVGRAGIERISRMRSKEDALAELVRLIQPSNALRHLVQVAKGAPSRVRTVASAAPQKVMALKTLLESESAA